ncbi:MAG TPA: discoidin domain-containing protein [Sedimentisphaerales bacterium]|nr:discoidin domain-containing protein [Sedimentisphaerales bacterium]
MYRKLAFLVLAVGLCTSLPASAANIIWVSFHPGDNTPGSGAAGTGFTTATDKGYTDLLKANGYNVTRYVTTATPDAALLNAADLVIISRSVGSANYQDAAATTWNTTITAPMMILGGYVIRQNRLGLSTGNTIPDTTGDIRLTAVDPTHQVFAGINLVGGVMENPYAGVMKHPISGATMRGISIVTEAPNANGKIIATVAPGSAHSAIGAMVIAEWPAGVTVTHAGGAGTDVLAGPRMVFLTGSRETDGVNSETAGYYDLYPDGAKMFINAVRYMLGESGETASSPNPQDKAVDVPSYVRLSWKAADAAVAHDVYFGTSLADVTDASRTNPKGVLVSQGQTETTYTPAQRLQYGQVYYWRVDEIGAAPASEVFKGLVWSFTAEPLSYPITNIMVTASSSNPGMVPENTINRSGLDPADQHSVDPTHMWLSASGAAQPTWIRYEFDKAYKLDKLQVWNSNQALESILGFGAKDVTVECSLDGQTWTSLGDFQFPRAPGAATYLPDEPVDFDGAIAKFVKLTINSNWGGIVAQYGLSEVRFFFVPVQARQPVPAVGATGVDLDAELSWRPGREAASHKVYFGKDAEAVTAGTATAATVTDHSFTPTAVEFGTPYYWRVDEVNNAQTPSVYEGEVWNYTTREYAVIDDFEAYNDDDNRIYDAWIDGVTDGKSGSTVGYMEAPFAERRIVHSGKQSMPLTYDNSASFSLSEAELTFGTAQNWTSNGADSFVLWFRGRPPAFAEVGNGNIIMNGIGADIWGTSDAFRLAYKTLNGDGTIVARVESLFNSNTWAKGGVMIRQSTEPGSVHAFMPITPGGGNGASFQHRLTAAGTSTNNDNAGAVVAAPYWVKLERKGNAFSGFISPDGVTWTQLGTAQTIPMTGPVLIGLALCSHDAAVATAAEFSNVSTTGNVTGSWQVAEIGAAQPTGNSVEGIYLSVKDNAGKVKVVQHPNAAATAFLAWQQWRIPLSEFTSAGVKMNAVKSLMIGVGNKAAPAKGGTGTVYIDDIGFGRPIQ